MSADRHLGSQFPGTERHPQGRLFAPIGNYRGDPWKLHPDNWMKQSETPAHDDVVSFHASRMSTPPRYDDASDRQIDEDYSSQDWNPDGDEDWEPTDFNVDSKERPMADYGSAVGLHLGDPRAGLMRGDIRSHVHPLRIPRSSMEDPPPGSFRTERPNGESMGGPYRSNRLIENAETGERTPDERWSDRAANWSERATDLVEEGRTLTYRNDYEAVGSTSYRTLPETTRTWSEDVLGSASPKHDRNLDTQGRRAEEGSFRGVPHPALVHLAQRDYNPVISTRDRPDLFAAPKQLVLGGGETSPGVMEGDKNFLAGRTWKLRKPDVLHDQQFTE